MIIIFSKKIVVPANIFIDTSVEYVDFVDEIDSIERRIMEKYKRILPYLSEKDILISINYVTLEHKTRPTPKPSYLPILYENRSYSESSL